MRLVADVVRHKVCPYTALPGLVSLASTSTRLRSMLRDNIRRRAMEAMRGRLATKLRPVRTVGKCALCERDTLHLIDMGTEPAHVHEGGAYCSNHCLRMQNMTSSFLLRALAQETHKFPVIGSLNVL